MIHKERREGGPPTPGRKSRVNVFSRSYLSQFGGGGGRYPAPAPRPGLGRASPLIQNRKDRDGGPEMFIN